jgi:O-antigen/teichoic acid export membrane protein
VAAIDTEVSSRPSSRFSIVSLGAEARRWLADRGDHSLAQRVAGTAFLIRVGSAGLAYLVQVLLARWMGSFEFGIYIYVWTWVLVIGGFVDLGLASATQRFIPDYTERKAFALLRGFLSGSRWIAFGVATLASIAGAGLVHLLRPWLDDYTIVPLYLACLMLPIYGVMHTQDGIARSYNWVNIALLPPFIVRQVVLLGLMAAAYALGFATNAATAIAVSAISVWLTGLGQTIVLNRKLARTVEPGAKHYDFRKWIVIAIPMFVVDSLYLMMLYVDVLVLKEFRSPEEIAVYYAASKTLSLVAFVYFAVSAATAHRYSEYHIAGDREKLASFLAHSIRWTFWPSLAATALILVCGWPMLWLFGAHFVHGYNLMFILAIGMLARAAVGPGERFLNMLGEQRACALVAGGAFIVNLVLCLVLIPRFGVQGAAISTSAAFVAESLLLFYVARRRLGFHLFIWGAPAK